MKAADKSRGRLILAALCLLSGCDRMITPPSAQIVKDADARSAQGDYIRAIGMYESALDGTPRSADIHYKLAIIYDDKMNDPLNAVHHFKRYLTLQPSGQRAAEVKEFIKRDEVTLLTTLSGDSVVMLTRAEVARLRNENLNLHKQADEKTARATANEKAPKAEKAEKGTTRAGGKTYTVENGDTLFSISRKFYKSPSHWKQIRDANKDKISNPTKLQRGDTLVIP